MADADYSPAQQAVIDLLGRSPDDDPPATDVVAELRAELEERLAPVAELIPPRDSLFVGKTQLGQLDNCEGRWQAESVRPFAWSVPAARGTVAHKAIELGIGWSGPVTPADLVEDALARLADDSRPIADFVRALSPGDRAELQTSAVALVTTFTECFPPLKRTWRPVVEASSRLEIAGGHITLAGKPDLTLGSPDTGGKVIIDLKTGQPRPEHTYDLRFYALVDACRLGTAPRRVASYYLDTAEARTEPVSTGTLEAATERVVRGVEAMVEIRTRQRPAALRASATCTWCPARADCEVGTAYLQARAEADPEDAFWWDPPLDLD